MKMLRTVLVMVIAVTMTNSHAQNGILIGTSSTLSNGAVLEVESNSKGMLIPRVDDVTSIASPADGLLAFQLLEPRGFFYYNGASWEQWTKPTSGTVAMTAGPSTVERGTGFTVNTVATGRDEIFFNMEYDSPPTVHVTGGIISGVAPIYPSSYCPQVTSACNTVHIEYLNIDYQNNGSVEFQTGTDDCNIPAPGNRLSYSLTDPEWVLPPPVMLPGQVFELQFRDNGPNQYVSVYVDWNQNGAFEGTERVYTEPNGTQLIRNESITIPAGACAGTTAVRLTVTTQPDLNIGCGLDGEFQGETEEVEIQIGGGTACVYQERQTVCNASGVLTDRMRVECTDLNGAAVDARYHFTITDN